MSTRLDGCIDNSLTWSDVGARNRADFVDQCRLEWDRTSARLTSSDLREALDICRTGSVDLDGLTCDEIRAIFAP